MNAIMKLDKWSLSLFIGICLLILFLVIYKFNPLTDIISENFASSCGYSGPGKYK